MKISKRQLRRIIREEVNRRRVISEADVEVTVEELEELITQKMKDIEALEGYRMIDPDIGDVIAKEDALVKDLKALHKKLSKDKQLESNPAMLRVGDLDKDKQDKGPYGFKSAKKKKKK